MSLVLTVYTFEDREGRSETDWYTQSFHEAREYAQRAHCRIIANTYEWVDDELIESYCEGEALDGTRFDDEVEEDEDGDATNQG